MIPAMLEVKPDRGAPATRIHPGMAVVVVRVFDPARRHLEGRTGAVIGFDWDTPILSVDGEVLSAGECYWGPLAGFPGPGPAAALAAACPATTMLWPA